MDRQRFAAFVQSEALNKGEVEINVEGISVDRFEGGARYGLSYFLDGETFLEPNLIYNGDNLEEHSLEEFKGSVENLVGGVFDVSHIRGSSDNLSHLYKVVPDYGFLRRNQVA